MDGLLVPSLVATLSSPALGDTRRLLHRAIAHAESGRLGWERRGGPALLEALCVDVSAELVRRGVSPLPCEVCRASAAAALAAGVALAT